MTCSQPVHESNNPLEVVVHHLLIGGMTNLGYQNMFPMMSALIYMITHWIRPMVSHNVKLSNSHDFTKLLHYVVSQLWENIELMLKLEMALTYR